MNQLESQVLKFDKKRNNAKFCPCGKNNKDGKFAPYVGFVDCGFCHSCGETFLPKIETLKKPQIKEYYKPISKLSKPISFISVDLFRASLNKFNENNFILFLLKHFGSEISNKLISKYFLGTSKHWKGSTIFWQIDKNGKIRTGKIMLYNATDCKRIKEPINHIAWVHKAIKQPEFDLHQCFFGEHLLKESSKPVAIVESEKTAIISSVYLPQLEWLAVGGKENLSFEKMEVLKGRKVIFFPDLNCLDSWKEKANEFSSITTISVSELLEKYATETEKKNGLDLADYLLKFDLTKFKNNQKRNFEKDEVKTNSIESVPKGKPFFQYELIEKFNLSPETIRVNFNECFAGALWIPI